MSIVKMKFASVISDHEHLDAMLMASSRSGLLHPELAINIINEDNGGKVLVVFIFGVIDKKPREIKKHRHPRDERD